MIGRSPNLYARRIPDGRDFRFIVHYNGWGKFPNPNGYTTAKIHGRFEGKFVREWISEADAAQRMQPFRGCGCAIERRVSDYLAATNAQVVPLYELEKKHAFDRADLGGKDFVAERLAAGRRNCAT